MLYTFLCDCTIEIANSELPRPFYVTLSQSFFRCSHQLLFVGFSVNDECNESLQLTYAKRGHLHKRMTTLYYVKGFLP